MKIYYDNDTVYTTEISMLPGETIDDVLERQSQSPKISYESFMYYSVLFVILFGLIVALFSRKRK